jgi:hypothetical protein
LYGGVAVLLVLGDHQPERLEESSDLRVGGGVEVQDRRSPGVVTTQFEVLLAPLIQGLRHE